MILFLDNDSNIYAFNKHIPKEEIKNYDDAVWFDGDFDFLYGEEKTGYRKLFYLREGKIEIEYKLISEPEPTMEEKIYTAVSKSQDEIRQEGADMVMEEMKKRGLIV